MTEDGLESYIAACENLFVEGGLVCLRSHRSLLRKSVRRRQSNLLVSDRYLGVAREFAAELASLCPFVKAIAVCGSLATGGFSEEDDIDFNIVTEDGARYITYLMANLLGLRYSFRMRGKPTDRLHQMPLFPKVICVNVIVEESWATPFVRQDEQMAFELLLSRPLHGAEYFRKLLASNSWLSSYFPQIYRKAQGEEVTPANTLLKSALRLCCRPRLIRRLVDTVCRAISWAFYQYVHWSRRGDPEAVERIEFIRRVKEPYEVFQD